MAKIKIIKNIFTSDVEEFEISKPVTIETLIREHSTGEEYSGTLLECYNSQTGETFFKDIENDENFNVFVLVNKREQPLSYEIREDDEVVLTYTPFGGGNPIKKAWDATIGRTSFTEKVILGITAIACPVALPFVLGGMSLRWYVQDMIPNVKTNGSADSGIQGKSQPDVRGSKNQSIIGQSIPFVMGKHLATPFIAGSTYNVLSGESRGGIHYGERSVIHALYVVGFAPLRITDFKLGDLFLAHNQPWANNQSMKNIFHGKLTGIDRGPNTGDIVNKWKNNNVSLEILQQGQNGEAIDYGEIYPYARLQENVDASLLFIADGALEDGDLSEYKGLALANGLRTNRIQFTEQCPKKITVELDAPSGLYKTRSETSDNNSRTHYRQIPVWLAIQWRVYSEVNDESDGTAHGVFEESYDPVTNTYGVYDETTQTYIPKRSWHSFKVVNGLNVGTYTAANRNTDIAAHTGNNGLVAANINNDWLNAEVFNFQSFCGTDDSHVGISEIRFQTSVDLEAWARENLVSAGYTEDEFINKFKSYFLDGSNTNKCIEVRCVRVSPCYMNETVSSNETSAYNFNDIIKWKTLTTEPFDKDKLEKEGIISQVRPIPEDLMRKLCVVSLEAKVDSYDQISGVLDKLSCVAESFAPFYDDSTKRWVPENVCKLEKYYKPRTETSYGVEITKAQFEEDRQNGIKSERVLAGNDYVPNLVNNVIRIDDNKEIVDEHVRYFIPETLRPYYNNNVASMFLLSAIGPQNGVDALGYSQSNFETNGYGDFDLPSFTKWFKWAEDVTDGSTYPSSGWHYDHDGNRQQHEKDDIVHIYFTANAYLFTAQKLENILAGIAVAGRAIYTYDSNNRITIVVDKPESYPVGLINQQNTLESNYSISFNDSPSGLQLSFPDEDDGYVQNVLYCMADGERADAPKKAIEPYEFKYVTNSYQIWSLGRYYLASRLLNKEVVTKKLGTEGLSIGLGNLVLIQDDTMLIGTDTGGRITKLIEDNDYIYGFLINNTYHYTGETEVQTDNEGNPIIENGQEVLQCKCGVVVMQPMQYKASRVITLRLAMNGTSVTIGDNQYTLVKGNTNVVLFANRISKSDNTTDGSDYYVYTPKVENIVGFGYVGKETAVYRIISIKKDEKHHYTFTLAKYQEELYNYGRELPSFQNNMTVPDRSGEDSFDLSENATFKDLNSNLNQAANLASGTVLDTLKQVPQVPSIVSAKATRDGITVNSTISNSDANLIDYIVYYIEKEDGTHEELRGRYSVTYPFNRSVDGYPEASNLANWQVKVKAVSVFQDGEGDPIESDWSSFTTVSTTGYGTWVPPAVTVIKEVLDRSVILTALYNSGNYYGTQKALVKIKRVGNTDPIATGSQRTFNDMLGITPDAQFYTPEFDKSVQISDTLDNEGNYRKNTTTAFESDSLKISHTLPLIGQTGRIFKEGNIFTGTFTKDVEDYDTVPQSPTEGLVIHYTGDDIQGFAKNGYYLYESAAWQQVYNRKQIVPTTYVYSVQLTNESGNLGTAVDDIAVTALCTNIADIVHSHEHYKDLFVEKLSAINANIGLISQGGMGSFEDMLNCWALSDLSAEDSGVPGGVMKGTFRVGDENEYFRVTPFLDENNNRKFRIELKAGNIELTTDVEGNTAMDLTSGTYVYNSDKTVRLKLLPEGMTVQKRVVTAVTPAGTENPKELGWYEFVNGVYVPTGDTAVQQGKSYYTVEWVNVSKLYADSRNNMILTNSDTVPDFGYQVEGTVYHFDDSTHPDYEESATPTNPESISCTGDVIPIDSLNPVLIPETSPNCIDGEVTKDISQFEGDVVFFSTSDGCKVGNKVVKNDGTTTSDAASSYNDLISADSGAVGSYLGLTQTQIDNGIFEGE